MRHPGYIAALLCFAAIACGCDDRTRNTGSGDGDTDSETDVGDCCTESANPGCSNTDIETCVCQVDPYCCDTAWDGLCADEVDSLGCAFCDGVTDCEGCTPSQVDGCESNAVVVGHNVGGDRTVCVDEGNGIAFRLAVISHDTTNWTFEGAVWRLSEIQIWGYDPIGTVRGADSVPTTLNEWYPAMACDPHNYGDSLSDCAAHTGWAGCVFDVDPSTVCHMELGLQWECSQPYYSCLSIDP